MAFEHKPNTGTIFRNSFKKSDKHPDWRGTLNVDGKVYEISLWGKEVNGKEILSASIQEPYKKENKVTNEPPTLKEQKQEDDNLPF